MPNPHPVELVVLRTQTVDLSGQALQALILVTKDLLHVRSPIDKKPASNGQLLDVNKHVPDAPSACAARQ
jgi:hypothetical protein